MYQAFIFSESLHDPTWLNDFNQQYVCVEYHPENGGHPPYWHLFKIEIATSVIDNVTAQLSQQLKPGWYAHAWDLNEVRICLPGQAFTLKRSDMTASEALDTVKRAARAAGIADRHLDFWIED